MATFEVRSRLEWDITMQLSDEHSGSTRDLRVCDDGWKIWLKDSDDGRVVYTISNRWMSERQSDRDSAMNIIRTACGWWTNNREMFTDPWPYHKEPASGK